VMAAEGEIKEAIRHLRQAHKLQPDSLKFSNGLAWVIATEDKSSPSDRDEALLIADAAAKKTEYNHPQILDTLAAAHAASGEFDKAIAVANQAIKLATQGGSQPLADEIRARLQKYRLGKPYRELHPQGKD